MNDYKNINAQKCKNIAKTLKIMLGQGLFQYEKFNMTIRDAIEILENIDEYHIAYEINFSDMDFYKLLPEDRVGLIKKQLANGISKHIADNMEIEQRIDCSKPALIFVGHFICINNRNQGIKQLDNHKQINAKEQDT